MIQRRSVWRLLWPACLGCCLLVFAGGAASRQRQQQQQQQTPDQLLKMGFFYYNNDDISDKAATQFSAVIRRDPNSAAAETAQYYLGGYYQRKYYVQKAKSGKPDRNALLRAKTEYKAYTDKYYRSGSHQWLADAFFNLALVYLQLGDTKNAEYELNKMGGAAGLDNSVYVYQVIYSQSPSDILDGYFQTGALKNFAASVIYSNQSFDQKIEAIKNWCRQQQGARKGR